MKGVGPVKLKDKVTVVTGGASGIGEACCRKFKDAGAKAVVVVDRDAEGAKRVADAIGGVAMTADVANEDDIVRVINDTEAQFGPIDLFFSNAGIGVPDMDHAAGASNEAWQDIWEINVMSHVYAARALLPKMIKRGGGYLLSTASAAGLLSQIGSAAYSVTKAGAVAFAENLSIMHGDQGIKVSVFCPQAVLTEMTRASGGGVAAVDGMMQADEVADIVVEGIEDERFLILSHPEVQTYMERKISDRDRWIGGMQRLRNRFVGKN